MLLTQSDIEQFPCKELQQIDRLWLKTSRGKFGFSVIHKVYQAVNCNYSDLASYVGWREGENWFNYDQINFTNDAPVGHLPVT